MCSTHNCENASLSPHSKAVSNSAWLLLDCTSLEDGAPLRALCSHSFLKALSVWAYPFNERY